jgi:hypothetical protein
MNATSKLWNRCGGLVRAAAGGAFAAAAGFGAMLVPTVPVAASSWSFMVTEMVTEEEDVIVLKAGNIEIRGEILEETDTTIKIKGKMSGFTIEKEFNKSDVASITRGKKPAADKPAAPSAPGATPPSPDSGKPETPAGESESKDGKKKIYVMELTGEFGVDISQTPIRDAMKDAQRNEADVIIVVLDSKPKPSPRGNDAPSPTVEQLFDEIFRAEAVTPIFVEEMPRDWKKMPRVVFWVKNAIGGSALLPFICSEVYMAPESFWGGIGYLTNQYDGVGDAVVREKQYSLRIGHAQGWAIAGGYNPMLINAMSAAPYVMSYKITGDKVEFFERVADPLKGEVTLTDDAQGSNRDTLKEILDHVGNDCLTFRPEVARDIRVSRGTFATLDDLIHHLGYERTGEIIQGRSKSIMEGWKRQVSDAKTQIRKAFDEYQEVRVEAPGDYQARTKARGIRRNRLERMMNLMQKFEESISGQWIGMNRLPQIPQIRQLIDNIKIEQLADGPGR